MAFGINPGLLAPSYGPQMLGGLAQQSLGGYQQAMAQQPQLLNSGLQAAMSQIGQAQALRANIMQRAHLAAQEQQQQAAQQMGQMFMAMAAQRQQAQQAAQALQQHALLSSLDRQSRESMNTQDIQGRADVAAQNSQAQKDLYQQEGKLTDPTQYAIQLMGGNMDGPTAMAAIMTDPSRKALFMAKFPNAFPAASGGTGDPLNAHLSELSLKHLQGTATPAEEAEYQKATMSGMMRWESDKERMANQDPAVLDANALLNDYATFTKDGTVDKRMPDLLSRAKKIEPKLPPDSPMRGQFYTRFGQANFGPQQPVQGNPGPLNPTPDSPFGIIGQGISRAYDTAPGIGQLRAIGGQIPALWGGQTPDFHSAILRSFVGAPRQAPPLPAYDPNGVGPPTFNPQTTTGDPGLDWMIQNGFGPASQPSR